MSAVPPEKIAEESESSNSSQSSYSSAEESVIEILDSILEPELETIDMASGLYAIEKLDEQNYASWCVQMRSVLIHTDLWKVVSGKLERTTANATEWESIDEKALATMVLSVKPTQLNHIKNCKNSAEAWNKLESIYKPKGPARKVTLYKSLLNLRLSEDGNIPKFIDAFTDIVEKLAEIGIEISDEMLVIILLSGLPTHFESFVIAMETRDKLPEFSALKIKLQEEYERRSSQKVTGSTQHAYTAQGSNTKKKHSEKSRKNPNNKQNGTHNKSKNNNECWRCGLQNHFARDCKSKKSTKDQKDSKESKEQSYFAYALSATTRNNNNSENRFLWIVDSGATSHMCNNKELFASIQQLEEIVLIPGNQQITAVGKGDVRIRTNSGNILLKNALYIPALQHNFFSVRKCVQNGATVTFTAGSAVIKNEVDNKVTIEAKIEGDLFVFESKAESAFACVNSQNKWHLRLGHVNNACLQRIVTKEIVSGVDNITNNNNNSEAASCIACMKSKISTQVFPQKAETEAENILDIIHTDVCGPFNVQSIGGSRYFLTFIDGRSRKVFVYFMKTKDQVLENFKAFKAMVEKQTGKAIRMLRSDNGGEFVNNSFDQFLEENGIRRQLTTPYTPQQNGVAERANRTLVEMARAMLVHAGLNEKFWAEAVATAVYIRNRLPSKAIGDITPNEIWHGKKPCVQHMKTFGCLAIALDKTENRKFRAKGRECIMMGYSQESKAYRLYDIEARKIIVKRDVKFDENKMMGVDGHAAADMMREQSSETSREIEIASTEVAIIPDTHTPSEEGERNDHVDDMQRSKGGRPRILRTGKPGRPRKVRNSVNFIAENVSIPQNISEIDGSEHKEQWQAAMKCEFDSLIENNTWSLVELPKNQKPIACKWVFDVKSNKDGEVERFKARLVAKGCSQQYGTNYTETFSPVIRYATLRMLFALAATHKLHLHQLDITTAYLNSELTEECYMQQPAGFVDEEYPDRVLRLNKAIYGLKQSGRAWNHTLEAALKKLNLTPCDNEQCLYLKRNKGKFCFVAVYVDDLVIGGASIDDIKSIKGELAKEFKLVDKGPISYFLGWEIERVGDTGAISVCQTKYKRSLLEQYGMSNCRAVSTPLDPGYKVTDVDETEERIDQTAYQHMIGELMYIAISTRPDIQHSVSKLAQYNSKPTQRHEVGAKHILRYLAKTIDLKLHYGGDTNPIQGYVDADWGGDTRDRKSYSGYVFMLGGGAISWESKKQSAVALSTTEAEYYALSTGVKEGIYLKRLLEEIGFRAANEPILIKSDNLSAQQLAKNAVYRPRTKHIDIRYHHVREEVRNKTVELSYVASGDMIADVLTKNLAKDKHMKFVNLMGLL